MLRKLLPIAFIALLMANCTPDNLPDDTLTNKEKMNQLVIADPLVWNSLATRTLDIDRTDSGMKAENDLKGLHEYPKDGYYYTIFEDLFPAQGDYDFNDIMLETKLFLDGKKNVIEGRLNATLINRGGSLNTRLGVMFYSVSGSNSFTVIDNEYITINAVQLPDNGSPFTMETPSEGENFDITFSIEDPAKNINQIWISWYIVVEQNGEAIEIHTAGFPGSDVKEFEIPQRNYLTINNLPWGLEIEAEEFYIPKERALFLDAFPEFQEWAETGGVKNNKWFENPDQEFIQ